MLNINKMIAIILAIGLSSSLGLFCVETSFAGETGGLVRGDDYSYRVKHRVISHPYLDVKVWVDKGDGATYHPGEDIKVYFQTSRDAYVVIYNIDTRGYVHLLYPVDRGDDPYVEGDRVYRIPDRFDDYDLTVDGPDGVEYIQAVASLEPIDYPNFPGAYSDDEEIYAYKLDGEDPFEFMAEINAEITSYDYASDVCIFNVEYPHPRWYYWPRVAYVGRPVDLWWGGAYFGYPWGVEVWIDGVYYGITPITIPALVVGRHYFSFWYRGCWIWRDWFYVRRYDTIRIWPDCYDRYRWVEERVVEKNYRAEKAKRRRGIEGVGGLVKPVRSFEKGKIARVETSRMPKDKEFKRESTTKQRGAKERLKLSDLSDDTKSRRMDKGNEPRIIRRSVSSKRNTSMPEREMKAKEIRPERKTPKRMERRHEFTPFKGKSITTKRMSQHENRRPEAKANKMRIGDRGQRVGKPVNVGPAPVKGGNPSLRQSQGGERSRTPTSGGARSSRPQTRRR